MENFNNLTQWKSRFISQFESHLAHDRHSKIGGTQNEVEEKNLQIEKQEGESNHTKEHLLTLEWMKWAREMKKMKSLWW
jgi:hypothetical protein